MGLSLGCQEGNKKDSYRLQEIIQQNMGVKGRFADRTVKKSDIDYKNLFSRRCELRTLSLTRKRFVDC